MKKTILGASIGNCVHVAGVIHFLNLASDEGYCTEFFRSCYQHRAII